MSNDLTFCKMPLDRASHLRKDSDWLAEKMSAVESCFYFYWQNKFLYVEQKVLAYSRNKHTNASDSFSTLNIAGGRKATFLGLQAGVAHFVFDLSSISDADIKPWLVNLADNTEIGHGKFIDFRRSLSLLDHKQAAILSYAKALIHWQHSALFCGCCGHKTQAMDGGHRLLCINEQCQAEQFPRTDPVVIMLVEYQPKSGPAMCLLAEHHRISEQVYSTLAGFVDPGESLTEAVTREVYEEVGIDVTAVSYVDSQPWPFPNSLMLGFTARAQSMKINLEEEELRSADWFTAEQLTNFHEWGDEVDGAKLPRKESIARLLIDSWCEKQRLKINK